MKLVLLIDDEESIRRTFGQALREAGFQVVLAATGDMGLELARQVIPDVIITDIDMPGFDGGTLMRQIRADPELRSKQVVILTGRPDLISPRRGMEEGADDYLLKPVTREALIACVDARMKRAEVHWRVEDKLLSQLRTSVASQVPHEFITPLAGILGLSEILDRDFGHLTPEEMRDLHHGIHHSAVRLHRTLRNYLLLLDLQFAPGESAKPVPALPPELVRNSIEAALAKVVERHDREEDIHVDIAKSSLQVDASDLAHIVEELIDNAVKFSRAGTPVKVSLDEKGVLLVTDSGRGMSPEEIGHIGAFRQFDHKKQAQQGLGLGLLLVQKLVARNNAKCTISRRSERGMEIRIDFQLASNAS